MSHVSQDYFDELCIENYEVFDMTCPQEAVLETIKQLQTSAVSSGCACSLRHLSLTYPDESGSESRSKIRRFLNGLDFLELAQDPSVSDCELHLDFLRCCMLLDEDDNSQYVELFLVKDGFSVFSSLISRMAKQEWSKLFETVLCTVLNLVSIFPSKTRSSFQMSACCFAQPLTSLLEKEVRNNCTISFPRITLILSIAYASILRCEKNKVLWMEICTNSGDFSSLLLSSLKLSTGRNLVIATEIQCTVCRIIASLCTYDDFRMSDNEGMASMQSCLSNVQAFYKCGALPLIHEILFDDLEQSLRSISVSAAFSALRALAIQDDVVHSMVNVGIIDSAAKILKETMDGSFQRPNEELVTSVLGFFRNASSNDDVKTSICIGKYDWIVPCMLQSMDVYRANVLLQEHCCGLIASMALRKPKNATALVAASSHTYIVTAIQKHVTSAALQRQAALAIRNLVARTPELRSTVLHECDVEMALRTIAAEHLACQDEVYAALRDLGLEVRSVHIMRCDDGTVTVQQSLPMFGERNLNFRPEFTTSEE